MSIPKYVQIDIYIYLCLYNFYNAPVIDKAIGNFRASSLQLLDDLLFDKIEPHLQCYTYKFDTICIHIHIHIQSHGCLSCSAF